MLDREEKEKEKEYNAEVKRENSRLEDEAQGWCSPEFSSGCVLDTDLD